MVGLNHYYKRGDRGLALSVYRYAGWHGGAGPGFAGACRLLIRESAVRAVGHDVLVRVAACRNLERSIPNHWYCDVRGDVFDSCCAARAR